MRILIFCIFIGIASCTTPPDYSDTPSLTFVALSKSTIKQGIFNEDSVTLQLYFTDGNGDFGTAAQSNESNIFIKDNRTNESFREYKAPFVPSQGANNGISGNIFINVYSTCCIFPANSGLFPCEQSDKYPSNDLTLDIYIKDRAGNTSNTVTSSIVQLDCR